MFQIHINKAFKLLNACKNIKNDNKAQSNDKTDFIFCI